MSKQLQLIRVRGHALVNTPTSAPLSTRITRHDLSHTSQSIERCMTRYIDTYWNSIIYAKSCNEQHRVEMSHQIGVFLSDATEAIQKTLQTEGACIISSISGEDQYISFCRILGEIYAHRDSASNGITPVSHNQKQEKMPGFSGFSQDSLEFHTDRSTVETPPAFVALYSASPALAGGYSRLVDGAKLCSFLSKQDPDAFAFLTSSHRCIYDDSQFIYRGPLLYSTLNGKYGIRFRCDGNGYYSFNDLPIVARIINCARKFEHSLVLEKDQALIINNERWLHGRTAFQGDRSLLRILLKPGSWFSRGFEIENLNFIEAA